MGQSRVTIGDEMLKMVSDAMDDKDDDDDEDDDDGDDDLLTMRWRGS